MNYIYESFDGGKSIFRREGSYIKNNIDKNKNNILNGNHILYESSDQGKTLKKKKILDDNKSIIKPIHLFKSNNWGIWDEV